MYYALAQRWALALAAAIHDAGGGDARWPGGMPAGPPFRAHAARILDEQWGVRDRTRLDAVLGELHAAGAYPEVVAVAGWGARAELVTEARAFVAMMAAARAAQAAHASWLDFAQARCAGSEAHAAAANRVLAREDSPWRVLPWAQPLDGPMARRAHVRAVACRACGARKVRPAPAIDPSAHVHCDFCGELTDVDYRILMERAGAARPTQVWRELIARHGAALAAGRAARDEAALRAVHRAIHDAMTRECPTKYSPRIADLAYRAAIVEIEAEMGVASDLDDETQRLGAACAAATRALQAALVAAQAAHPPATRVEDLPRVPGAPFWAMYDALAPMQQHVTRMLDARGLLAAHPDRLTPELHARIATSVTVQSWLPMLADDDAARLLEVSGLRGEYVAVPADAAVAARACGGCGGALEIAAGARRVVCDFCGRRVAVGAPEIGCPTCGAKVSVADGASQCPYCASAFT